MSPRSASSAGDAGPVRDLKSPDTACRLRAATDLKLAATRGPIQSLVGPLAAALGDPDARVREAAAKAIGNAFVSGAEAEAALKPLFKALADPVMAVVIPVAWALSGAAENGADITPAVHDLLSLARSAPGDAAYWASMALGAACVGPHGAKAEKLLLPRVDAMKTAERKAFVSRLRTEGLDLRFAVAPLALLSQDGDGTVSEWSLSTVVDMKVPRPELVARLAALLEHARPEIREGASASLSRLAHEDVDMTPALPALERSLAKEGSYSTGAALMAHFVRTLEAGSAAKIEALVRTAPGDAQRAVLRSLNGDDTPRAALIAAAPALEELCKHKGKNVREEAGEARARIALFDKDAPALEALLTHRNEQVRNRAALSVRKATEAGKRVDFALPLVAGLLGHKDAYLRWTAACALGAAGRSGAAIAAFRAALENGAKDADKRTAEACREALKSC